MKRVLVIADDLTGAAEIGGIAVEHGLTAHIVCDELTSADADLLVIDTDSRQLSVDAAAARLRRILRGCDVTRYDLVYKKTDSVMRGPIAGELNAIMELGFARALLVPQNPSRGRTIRGGQYYIDGVALDQTSFADDPDHPVTTSDVHELLSRAGGTSDRITIGEGASQADLRELAQSLDSETLPAGGADFFTAMLETRGHRRVATHRAQRDSPPSLFICGSASKYSRDAVNAGEARGVAVCDMPTEVNDDDLITRWADRIASALQVQGKVVAAVRHPLIRERAAEIRRLMSEVIAQVLQSHRPKTLWIEGGATAAAIVRRMGWRDLRVIGSVAPGVVELETCDNPAHPAHPAHPAQRLIIKPGSYPWPAGAL